MWTYWYETDITYQICILGDSWTESWSFHSFHSLGFVTLSPLIECSVRQEINSLETTIISLRMMLISIHRYSKQRHFSIQTFFVFTYTYFLHIYRLYTIYVLANYCFVSIFILLCYQFEWFVILRGVWFLIVEI